MGDWQLHVLEVSDDKFLVDLSQTLSDSHPYPVTSLRDSLLYLGEGTFIDGGKPAVSVQFEYCLEILARKECYA